MYRRFARVPSDRPVYSDTCFGVHMRLAIRLLLTVRERVGE